MIQAEEIQSPFWGTVEVASFLGIHRRTVQRLAKEKAIPCFWVTKRCVRFDPDVIRAWFASRMNAGKPGEEG